MTPSKILFLTLFPLACGVASFAACSSPNSRTGFDNGSSGSSGGSGSDAEVIDFGDASINSTDVALNSETSCATGTAKTSKAPVYLQIMMDGSGSMSSDGKWTAATAAIKSIVTKYTQTPDPSFAMGLSIFSDSKDPSREDGNNSLDYPSSIDVPMAYTDSSFKSKVYSRLNGANPSDLTPILHVLQGGYRYLEGYTPRSPVLPNGKKVLVLITDGAPTDDNSGTAASTLAASKASEIPLFVIGVGDFPSSDLYSYDPVYLGKLAKAGGTGPANCVPTANQSSQANKLCYFQLTPGSNTTTLTNAFITAIDTIRGSINTCTLQIVNDPNSGEIDPSRINVLYTDPDGNQTTVLQDETDGWTYDDPNSPKNVILHGQACDNSKVDGAQYDLLLGCATKSR